MLSFPLMVSAEDQKSIPIRSAVTKPEVAKFNTALETKRPITVLANDPVINKKNQDAYKKKQLSAPTKINKNIEKPKTQIIHLPTPTTTVEIKNKTSYFMFEDITKREEKESAHTETLLSIDLRRQQVEALRQSLASEKNNK